MDKVTVLSEDPGKEKEKKGGETGIKENLSHFFIGAALAFASFFIAYVLTSFLFSAEHYIWRTISTLFVSYIFIDSYDYVTSRKPSLKAGPVKNFTILFAFIILVNGYNSYGQSSDFNIMIEDDFSGMNKNVEIIQITVPDSVYQTKMVYTVGQEITIETSQDVFQTDGLEWNKLFIAGSHRQKMTGTGNLAFKANATPVVIKIYR